jgi:hypothetical protein
MVRAAMIGAAFRRECQRRESRFVADSAGGNHDEAKRCCVALADNWAASRA